MNILNRIENWVALPGDSETFRTQKVLGTIILLFAGLSTMVNGFMQHQAGVPYVGPLYLALGIILLAGFTLVLIRPQYYLAIASTVVLITAVVNLPAHVVSGGYLSGMSAINWTMLAPILAVILVGPRLAIVTTILFVFIVIAAGFLDPRAVANAPDIAYFDRIQTSVTSLLILGIMLFAATFYLFRQIETYHRRADNLLLNILPGSIATRLKESTATIADGFSEVTVLFADIVDFTEMSSEADPVAVVNLLNDIFSEFDELAEAHGLEKIKTIGDAYMVAAGLPEPRPDHTEAITAFAIDMLTAVNHYKGFHGEPIQLRVGINTGPVVAGVIGRQKFIYDLWGDAVNVASRMESNGLVNQIQVTEAVKDKLEGQYKFEEREPIHIKGKGMMVTYLLQPAQPVRSSTS